MNLQYILWDWNGTLLNDVQVALNTNNQVFPTFGLPPLGDLAYYKEVFDFPIKDYYSRVGVNDAIFDDVAKAWAALFLENAKDAPLHHGAFDTLHSFYEKGIKQVILSASKQNHLLQQVGQFPISHFFDDILGLNNIYAKSKIDLAKSYFEKTGLNPKNGVFIGDTTHDAAVAQALGIPCLLVCNGHQAKHRLTPLGVPVYDNLTQVANKLLSYC